MKKFILREKLEEFIGLLKSGEIEVYNEFSFQHELGYFLRNHLKQNLGDFKIQFERNFKEILEVSDDEIDARFGTKKVRKKEIDISIFQGPVNLASIELKFPRNGQVPESMYSFVKDVKFLEGLTSSKNKKSINMFSEGFFICLVDNSLFYQGGSKNDGIYEYFRGKEKKIRICKETKKPTGKNKDIDEYTIILNKEYVGEWLPIKDELHYLLIEV
jgi:hypothetical protein